MDYSSVCSELIESLDYLRPPVKRSVGSPGSACNVGGVRVLKHFRTKFTKKTQFPQTKRRGVGTSSSLIFNHIAGKEVAENYTELSNSNLYGLKENERSLLTKQILGTEEKPTIQITVTPKTEQTLTSSILKKRKRVPKKVQATVSNHEINSIKAKNLFLVVGGQLKEKVYQFKRTGSAKLINKNIEKCKDDNISLDQVSSLKLVLESLKMNRHNEMPNNGASRRLCNSPECPFASRYHQESEMYRECGCSNTAKGDNDVNTRRSCVRVTGRLGLTEDDRYVLKYNTTVDDEPVDLHRFYMAPKDDRRVTHNCNVETCPVLEGFARNLRSPKDDIEPADLFRNECCRNNYTKSTHPRFKVCACCDRLNCSFKAKDVCSSFSRKDCNVQVNLPDVRRNCETASASCGTTSRYQKCQSSTGTQVNFKVGFTKPECYTCVIPDKDEIIQCCCNNEDEECCNESSSSSDCDDKCLKRCQSPMVVISVYPMQSDSENVKVVTGSPNDRIFLPTQKSTKTNSKVVTGSPNDRRFIPTQKSTKTNSNNEVNTTKKIGRESRSANNSPSKSRSRSPSPQSKSQSKTNLNENKVLRTNNSRKSSPVRDRNTSPSKTSRPDRIKKEKPISSTDRYRSFNRPDRSKKVVHKGTNTDHNVTKKLLVDNYTKHLTALMQENNLETDCDCLPLPQIDSKVNINIDGGIERYDIFLNQGVKEIKTVKMKNDSKKGRCCNDNVSPTIKNLNMVPEKDAKHRQVSQATHKNEHKKEDTFTRLRVRDSLEISHRREGSTHSHTDSFNKKTKSYNKDKPSPIKHYRGDGCPIPDPLERDQEIRALLGVDKGKHVGTSMAHPVNYMRQRCAYDDKCFRDLQKFDELRRHPSKECVCTDVMKKYYSQSSTKITNGGQHNKKNSETSMQHDRISNSTSGDEKTKNFSNNIIGNDNRTSNGIISKDIIRNSRTGKDRVVSNDRLGHARSGHHRMSNKIPSNRINNGTVDNTKKGYASNSDGKMNSDTVDNARNGYDNSSDEKTETNKVGDDRMNKDKNDYDRFSKDKLENAGSSNSNSSSLPMFDPGPTVDCKCPKEFTEALDNRAVGAYSELIKKRPSKSSKKVNCACSKINSTEKMGFDKFLKYIMPKKSAIAVTKGTQYEDDPVGKDAPLERGRRTSLYQQLILNRNIQIFLQVEQFSKQKPIVLSRKQYHKVKRTIENTILNKSRRRTCICKTSLVSVGEVRRKTERRKPILSKREVETQQQSSSDESKTATGSSEDSEQKAYFVFTGDQNKMVKKEEIKQVASTVEFRCASMSYTKYVTFSSTNVEVGSVSSALDEKESLSLHTIFKGRRRCATPNLGTSVYSLNSEDEECPEPEIVKRPPICEPKSKKPLLKRLMSCLVMRSRVADMDPHIDASPPPSNKPSIGSTFDAYHISSSFCGVEMSSSMYDTSISFYTNHSVYPINSKIKRGFFNSVREFLSIRRSQSMKYP